MAQQCLRHYTGDTIAHIGELLGEGVCLPDPWGRTTDADFQIQLATNFHKVRQRGTHTTTAVAGCSLPSQAGQGRWSLCLSTCLLSHRRTPPYSGAARAATVLADVPRQPDGVEKDGSFDCGVRWGRRQRRWQRER